MTQNTMKAVVTTGIGGFERLEYREVPEPIPGPGEVLIRVLSAGVNNTDVNTRLGWYSSAVAEGTDAAPALDAADGGWRGPTPFPLIQGADCCGVVEEVGAGVEETLLGRRVLVRPCMRTSGFASMDTAWLGSDVDGAFAEYVKAPAKDVFRVDSDWTDAQLGGVPVVFGTAENMLHRAAVMAGDEVLITGASGGVGAAAVQLANVRGAEVTAVCSSEKAHAVAALGAAHVLARDRRLSVAAFDVVVDTIGGRGFPAVLSTLRRGGRYVTSGAIAGPLVELDLRTLYLNDLTLIGATAWDEPVFHRVVALVESNAIRPPVVETFQLDHMEDAQRRLLERRLVGRIVLIPPAPARLG